MLIVTMHMGNWELGMWPITLAGVRPGGVYRLVKNPYVDRYLRAQRQDLYPGGLFGSRRAPGKEEGQKTARLIMDYVRQGGRLGFISDLYDAQGVEVPFFGYPAKSMPIAAMIARRVGARIWIGRCVRIGKRACFDINVNELRVPRTNNRQKTSATLPPRSSGISSSGSGKTPTNSCGQTGAGLEFCISLICR